MKNITKNLQRYDRATFQLQVYHVYTTHARVLVFSSRYSRWETPQGSMWLKKLMGGKVRLLGGRQQQAIARGAWRWPPGFGMTVGCTGLGQWSGGIILAERRFFNGRLDSAKPK